jgi:subtilisin family serine protease/subtilisin-like proprotein convertase family protein
MNDSRLLIVGVCSFAALTGFAQTPAPALAARYHFRESQQTYYRVEAEPFPARAANARLDWVKAWPENGSRYPVEFGSRVGLQTKPGTDVQELLKEHPLSLSRVVAPNLFILQAPDAMTALNEAQRLADQPEALMSCPVRRRLQLRLHGPYAGRPNDSYFYDQWNLENRDANGASLGVDLNLRAAWPFTRGKGTVIAVADDGVDLAHPEFVSRASNDLHFYFDGGNGTTNAMPADADDNHSTEVAGLALAEGNNHRGMSGVAPQALLASWKIFLGLNFVASDEQMMDMFQYRSNIVSIENHSWGKAQDDPLQLAPTSWERIGISNALAFGRGGRGIVMVHSAGNGREGGMNANDDGYANDPRVLCVASVRRSGRVATYSNPGACLLVAAPGGDDDGGILTTDRRGAGGDNPLGLGDDFADRDYVFSKRVVGTSFSAPQISGLVALLLSANPNLTWRDVQQILILSARHFDLADPDVRTNGAGLRFSHNVGFGVPDAGQAVALAQRWSNRPPLTTVTYGTNSVRSIPDNALRVLITGTNVPANLASIPPYTPCIGPHVDSPTAILPLVDVGLASLPITTNLAGRAALIQRGGNTFEQKVQFAAAAGAAFVVLYDNGDMKPEFAIDAQFGPIPTVFINQTAGLALRDYLQTNDTARAQIDLTSATYSFNVTNALICEHVCLRVQVDHERRGDLRITLLSPAGTRSVLQHVNTDNSSGQIDWTYYSTLHFGESSAGMWTASISDEQPLNTGSVKSIALDLDGVEITDTDHDGLDDNWEVAHFGSMEFGSQDDPEGDGYSNAREQIMGTDPNAADIPFQLDLSPWDRGLARLSWAGVTNRTYEILAATNESAPMQMVTSVPGRFPDTEWFTTYTNQGNQFFRVRDAGP